jgi:hypothetical protein
VSEVNNSDKNLPNEAYFPTQRLRAEAKLEEGKKYELIISPSQIESFDHSSPFGCERKWWFKSILKWPEPQTESQSLGDALHATIEHYLGARPEAPNNPRAWELFKAGKHIVDDVKPEVLAVEEWMKLELAGCLVRGRIDLLLGTHGVHTVLDWKTTSSIERYAKNPQSLKTNTQLVLYAQYVKRAKECGNPLTLSHVYFQTRGSIRAERVSTQVTHEGLDAHTNNVIVPIVERMKVAAKVTDVAKTRIDTAKCKFCSFQDRCPKDSLMPSLKELLASYKSPATTPTASEPSAEPVLPPDAPASVPALAADPVPGFSPAVEAPAAPPPPAPVAPSPAPVPAKRGPGRPRKLKIEDAPSVPPPAPAPPTPAVAAAYAPAPTSKPAPAPSPVFFSIKRVTLSHGLTLNMGNFNSARVDLSMDAEVDRDESAVLDALSQKIRERLNQELSLYQTASLADGSKK